MITQVNSSNEKKYHALYAKAMDDLQTHKNKNVNINSLETYFAHIEDLLELSNGRKYTILPLDEEYFEIDTNTRMIKVPEAFRKNGIAVQGDMGAETIYFKVPRYFDAMDLDHTTIYIQWQYTNSQSGQPEQGISHEWVRDIESEDDYLIFGWALGGRITEEAGTLQFSVRFINGERDAAGKITDISYSLSTLTTTVLINPGLNFGLDEVTVEDLESIISSNYTNTNTATDSELKIFQYAHDFNDLDNIISINDFIVEKDLIDGKIDIQLSVYADPLDEEFRGDRVQYYLYKQLGSKPNVTADKVSKIDMINNILESTDDTSYQENGLRLYYHYIYSTKVFPADGTGYEIGKFYIYDEDTKQYLISENVFDPNTTYYIKELDRYYATGSHINNMPSDSIYEKYGKITLVGDSKLEVGDGEVRVDNVAGTYYGVAKAIINQHESSPQYTQYKLTIPGPVDLVLDNENIKYDGLFVQSEQNLIQYPTLSAILKQYGEKDKLYYQWYKVNSEIENPSFTEDELVTTEPIENTNTFVPTSTGKYYAKIVANRNCSNSNEVITNKYIVTEKPKAPGIKEGTGPVSSGLGTAITFEAIDYNDKTITDSELVYNLYRVDAYEEDNTTPIRTYIASSDSPSFTVNTRGAYMCGIVSKYNGDTSKETFTPVVTRT